METIIAASRLEALGNPTRLSLYRALVRAGHGGLSVGDCQSRLGIAPAGHRALHLSDLGLNDHR